MNLPQISPDMQAYIILGSLSILMIYILIIPFIPWITFRKSSLLKLRKRNFEILKKLSENIEKGIKINDFLKDKKTEKIAQIKLSIEWLKRRGVISGKRTIKITDKGLLQLNKNYYYTMKDSDKRHDKAITILLTILSIIILYTTLNVQIVQTKILEGTNAPIQATLEFIPDKNDLIIPAFEFSRSEDIKHSESGWATIELTILNFGKMDSNHVNCYQTDYNNEFFGFLTPNPNFQNILAGSSNLSVLHIRYDECYNGHEEYCDKPELVPIGVQNITLNCECYGCKDQRRFEEKIEFCVYNKDKSICNEFEKSLK